VEEILEHGQLDVGKSLPRVTGRVNNGDSRRGCGWWWRRDPPKKQARCLFGVVSGGGGQGEVIPPKTSATAHFQGWVVVG